MKFYFIELTHKISGKVFYKFGITQSSDVLNRFTDIYPERKGYQNFNIRVLFSKKLNESDAEYLEETFLDMYPKIKNISNILKDGFDYNFKNTSGLSEWRTLSVSQKNSLLKILFNKTDFNNLPGWNFLDNWDQNKLVGIIS